MNQDSLQRPFAKHDYVVQTFPSNRADHPLDITRCHGHRGADRTGCVANLNAGASGNHKFAWIKELCRRDLEGVVAKWKFGPYLTGDLQPIDRTLRRRVKNPQALRKLTWPEDHESYIYSD
jgi:hypothetical protein